LRRCLVLSRELGRRHLEGAALDALGDLARAARDPAARDWYERGLEVRRALSIPASIALSALSLGRHLAESGDPGSARPLLEEAEELTRTHALANPGPLPAAYLALIGVSDASLVSVTAEAPVSMQAEAHLVLYLARGDGQHLAAATRMVEQM